MTTAPEEAAPDQGEEFRLWPALREAIRGSQQDFTTGPIRRAILLLAVPMVLETAMESIFAVVDVFFVSRLGSDAIAVVGLTEGMMSLVYTVAIGLSIGVTAMVARRIGEKDPDGAARTAVQAVVLGLGIAGALGLVAGVLAPRLLGLMGASQAVIEMGSSYTRIMLGANGTVLLLFMINAIFRGAGDAAIAMRVLWLANGINIVLDPTLIFGLGPFPELGVQGAAVATNIGRGTAVLVQLYVLARVGGRVKVLAHHLALNLRIMWQLIRLSGTGTFQVFVGTASWIALIRILSLFGSEVVAGYTIGIRLIIFALLPSWGMSNAAATMVGQALGAKNPDRAEEAVWLAGFYNMVALGIVGVIFIVFAPQIVAVFTEEAEPARYGIMCLRIVSLGFLFYAYGMVLTQSFNGAGDTWTPTVINIFCFWLFELPVAYILAVVLGFEARGVFIAMTLAFSLLAVVSAIFFRRGKWKLKEV
ncbi:MAG: MATE family efflux transporter [Gemmatimonadetes bacterium]|nr:MATE family efflux transporter [Gemmatimonadota bacterium]